MTEKSIGLRAMNATGYMLQLFGLFLFAAMMVFLQFFFLVILLTCYMIKEAVACRFSVCTIPQYR